MYFFFLFLVSFAHADVMNLNNFMPTRLEDASPIDGHSFDIQASSEFEQRHTDMITYRPNIRYGITDDVQIESQGSIYSGNDERRSGETDFAVQYRFLKGENLPSFSITPLVAMPTGKKEKSAEFSIQLNGTYTLSGTSDTPKSEIHFNILSRSLNNRVSEERGSTENLAFGTSHRLSEYVAMIVNVALEEQSEKKDFLQVAELGLHFDLGSMNYIGISYSQGFGNSCTRSAGLIGYEKQIGP